MEEIETAGAEDPIAAVTTDERGIVPILAIEPIVASPPCMRSSPEPPDRLSTALPPKRASEPLPE